MNKSLKRIATTQKLQATGLQLFYTKGFYTTSIDDILKELDLSKGAFYYHFESKEDFFIQILQNLVIRQVYSALIDPINGNKNPLNLISKSFDIALDKAENDELDFGFILSNFLTEFNGKNDRITQQIKDIISIWEVNLITTLQDGKQNGFINRHVDCEAVATFIMSSYFGIRTLMVGSSTNRKKYQFIMQLRMYFNSLESKKITA